MVDIGMIKTKMKVTVRDLLQGKLDNLDFSGIYVFRDNDCVLYAGQSKDVITRLYEHIENWAKSCVGDIVRMNRPQSYSWQIELIDPNDCRELVVPFAPLYEDPNKNVSLDAAERAIIRYYGPCLNTTYNRNPHKLPERIKWLGELEVRLTDNLF